MADPNTYCNECGASNPQQATHCFACSTALQSPAPSPLLPMHTASANAAVLTAKIRGPLAPSSLLHSRYSIVSQIGTGGFGAVYQAKDTLFSHRLVAIKEMNQDGLSPQELAEATVAFEQEALLLADLTHPNLPRIHDHFTEHERAYVVMDFITGDTLEDMLDKSSQRLPVEATLDIGIQLCTVLDYLHSHQPPIIFRDLKPANIMRTPDNHVYLIDFGIARHFKPGKTKDTIPLGSRGYAPPEQYGKAQTTPQSDIYGLGATLHELLTGDDPSLSMFHFGPLESARASRLPIAAQLDTLLKQMVEMEMSKRPVSVAVVKQELQSLLAQQTPQKPIPALKRRTFVKGCLSVVATCSASIAIATILVEKPKLVDMLFAHPFVGTAPVLSPSRPVLAQARILSKPFYTYRGHTGSVTAVAWSPDGPSSSPGRGSRIASAGIVDSSVQVWDASTGNLVIVPDRAIAADGAEKRQLAREREHALFATDNQRVDALVWSSDGTHIAAALGNESVDIWNIATGDERLFSFIAVSQTGSVNALAVSPDGSRIAAVSGNIVVEVRSATTGELLVTYTGHARAVLALAWSPDGKRIASAGADGLVRIWNASTGHTYVAYPGHSAAVNAVAWSRDSGHIASGGDDGTVQVWEAATGRPLFTYRGHAGGVNTVAWQKGVLLLTGHTMRIASGGADGTVQVWSIGSGSNQTVVLQGDVLIYRGHSSEVTSVTWSPDGYAIASGSEDGTVQIWRAV